MAPTDRRASDPSLPSDLEATLVRNQPLVARQLARADRWRRVTFGGLVFIGSAAFLLLVTAIGLGGFTTTIKPDELGVVERLGKPHRQLPPGLHLRLPPPIEEVYVEAVVRLRTLDGDCYRTPVGGAGPVAPSGAGTAPPTLMLTGDGNAVSVRFSVMWRIRQLTHYQRLRNPTLVVCQAAIAAVREMVGRYDLATLLQSGRADAQSAARQRLEGMQAWLDQIGAGVLVDPADAQSAALQHMQAMLDHYGAGVRVDRMMLGMDPPPAVIDAFRDVAVAQIDSRKLKEAAQGYAGARKSRAIDDAKLVVAAARAARADVGAVAEADLDRFQKLYAEYKEQPEAVRRRLFEALEARSGIR